MQYHHCRHLVLLLSRSGTPCQGGTKLLLCCFTCISKTSAVCLSLTSSLKPKWGSGKRAIRYVCPFLKPQFDLKLWWDTAAEHPSCPRQKEEEIRLDSNANCDMCWYHQISCKYQYIFCKKYFWYVLILYQLDSSCKKWVVGSKCVYFHCIKGGKINFSQNLPAY